MRFIPARPILAIATAAGLGILAYAGTAAAQSQWHLENVGRFVAVADIHGAYDAFAAILLETGIVDESLNWSGGTDHLVIVGDVLDRGPQSRRALDLIMRLETAATTAGGAVHLVLGNHELMNLTGDLRYVSAAEYAAFAPDETPAMREAAFERYSANQGSGAGDTVTREAFDARFPAGFFAHREAFSAQGTYGAWLLDRPFLLVVDDWAFVHGGLAGKSQELLAGDMNATLGEQLRAYVIAANTLTDTGVLDPADNFFDHPDRVRAFADRVRAGEADWPAGAEAAAATVTELNGAFAFAADSPTWYRGNVGCGELIALDRVSGTLAAGGVGHLVVGHTPTFDATIHSRLDRLVYRVDTGMLADYYGGRASALIVAGPTIEARYENIGAPTGVLPEPDRIGRVPAGMTEEQIADVLATAVIVSRTPVDSRWSHVTLRRGDVELDAAFTVSPADDISPELAAWRLDRLLGLDMVPTTVAREIDGVPGTLQLLPTGVVSEEERQARGIAASAWCPLADQFGAMYIFDSLIGNTGRTNDRLLYSTDNFQLLLVGHDLSFSTQRSKPEHLREVPLPLTPTWVERLRALTEDSIAAQFSDVLDRRRIRALLGRRDRILRDAGIADD